MRMVGQGYWAPHQCTAGVRRWQKPAAAGAACASGFHSPVGLLQRVLIGRALGHAQDLVVLWGAIRGAEVRSAAARALAQAAAAAAAPPPPQARRPHLPARTNRPRRQFSHPCPWPWSYTAPQTSGVSGRCHRRGEAPPCCYPLQMKIEILPKALSPGREGGKHGRRRALKCLVGAGQAAGLSQASKPIALQTVWIVKLAGWGCSTPLAWGRPFEVFPPLGRPSHPSRAL